MQGCCGYSHYSFFCKGKVCECALAVGVPAVVDGMIITFLIMSVNVAWLCAKATPPEQEYMLLFGALPISVGIANDSSILYPASAAVPVAVTTCDKKSVVETISAAIRLRRVKKSVAEDRHWTAGNVRARYYAVSLISFGVKSRYREHRDFSASNRTMLS